MGAGKSTIGRLLSVELKLTFKDSDREIEERCGCNIPWIFDVEGETGFRDRESATIDAISQESGVLMATGGGAVLREDNRRFLKSRGTVIYLKTSVEQQLSRTAKDRNRPLLQTPDPEVVLRTLFQQRDPLYQEVADLVIQTDERHPKYVVQEIVERLQSLNIIEKS